MEAKYNEVWFVDGQEVQQGEKTVTLPFGRASARALIIRRGDGAILGTLHHEGGKLAPPGGAIDDGESSADGIVRELEEENIQLVGNSQDWETRIAVGYFAGYKELSIWHIFDVEDAVIGECDENILSRWVGQEEDVWYPNMRKWILLTLETHLPALSQKTIRIL